MPQENCRSDMLRGECREQGLDFDIIILSFLGVLMPLTCPLVSRSRERVNNRQNGVLIALDFTEDVVRYWPYCLFFKSAIKLQRQEYIVTDACDI